MPLFKGKGCKSLPRKALAYITDETKATYVTSCFMDDNRDYAEQFADTAALFAKGKKYDERKYYHFKLSCDPQDNVTAGDHHIFAERVAETLFANYESVIATHEDTRTIHSHIIVNAVNFVDGRKLHCSPGEYGKLKDKVNELGLEYGYTPINFRQPAREKVTSEELSIKLKGGRSWKDELRGVIQYAIVRAQTMNDFEKNLAEYGVKLTRNTGKTIAYKHPQKEKSIRGEKLGTDYTSEAIRLALERARSRNYELEGYFPFWGENEPEATFMGKEREDEYENEDDYELEL